MVSVVPQGDVLGSLLFLLDTSEFFYVAEIKYFGYPNDSSLRPVVQCVNKIPVLIPVVE